MKKIYFVLLVFLSPLAAYSQWNTNPAINTPVSIAAKNQGNIHMVTDGNGGAVLAWDDNRTSGTTSTDIYAQRLDMNGNAKWAANGVAICTNTFLQKSVNIIDSDKGSTIITWEDSRAGNLDIYAQKIDSTGAVLWALDGVPLTTKLTNQQSPKIISDTAGGAIIVWEDSINSVFDVYAQRINSAGIVQWTTNGVAVCTATNLQVNPKIDTDGAGGAIITWQDKRNGNDYDIYAQHINDSGTALWTANGIAICVTVGTQSNPRIEPDGNNGAIIAWVDKRNGNDYDVYSQRINATGTVQWANNGIVVCNAVGNQSAVDLKYLGSTGFVVSWKDLRNSTYQIYSQLMNLSGTAQLSANGIKLSNGLQAINSNAIADGQGAAIIVWQDSTASGWNIKSQKLNSTGVLQWISGGETVCDAIDNQINASNVSDGKGGAIFAWEDFRGGTTSDVYANRISHIVTTGIESNVEMKQTIKCFPNPVSELNTSINIISKTNFYQTVEIYNSEGQLVTSSSTNENGLCIINTSGFSNGLFFFRIHSENNSVVEVGNFIVSK